MKQTRHEAHNIIHGKDDRLLVVIGPCLSIHDPKVAIEYDLFKPLRKYKDSLEIIMCVFEKNRVQRWVGKV